MDLFAYAINHSKLGNKILEAIGIDSKDIPRMRGVFVNIERKEPKIIIHTRTGGGNRDYYEFDLETASEEDIENFKNLNYGTEPTGPFNSNLRKSKYFLYDADDEDDCTYANFFYKIPEDFKVPTEHELVAAFNEGLVEIKKTKK